MCKVLCKCEGLRKETEIAALWVEKGKVHSKLPRLSPQKAERRNGVGGGCPGEKELQGGFEVHNKYL